MPPSANVTSKEQRHKKHLLTDDLPVVKDERKRKIDYLREYSLGKNAVWMGWLKGQRGKMGVKGPKEKNEIWT